MIIKTRYAVIGCGRMGAFTNPITEKYAPKFYLPLSHSNAILNHKDTNLVAFCDSSTFNLNKAAKQFNIYKTYESYKEMIDENDIDLLSIATRTNVRSDIIQYAFKKGIRAVHAEKPLCNSMRQLEELENIFEKEDFYFTWGALRRFFDVYKEALNIVKSNTFGKLVEIKVSMGSVPLFWSNPHSIDLILFYAEARKIKTIQAKLDELKCQDSIFSVMNDPIIKSCLIEFDDGVMATINQGNGCDIIHLTCERGEVSVTRDGHDFYTYSSSDDDYPIIKYRDYQKKSKFTGTSAPINQLISCLKHNKDEILNNKTIKNDILISQKIMFAIVQSHIQKNTPVTIDEIDSDLHIAALTGGKYA